MKWQLWTKGRRVRRQPDGPYNIEIPQELKLSEYPPSGHPHMHFQLRQEILRYLTRFMSEPLMAELQRRMPEEFTIEWGHTWDVESRQVLVKYKPTRWARRAGWCYANLLPEAVQLFDMSKDPAWQREESQAMPPILWSMPSQPDSLWQGDKTPVDFLCPLTPYDVHTWSDGPAAVALDHWLETGTVLEGNRNAEFDL